MPQTRNIPHETDTFRASRPEDSPGTKEKETGADGTVAIIGGGFTGAAVAWNMARSGRSIDIVVFEPRSKLGAGLAYDTTNPVHRINVPASRMSISSNNPGDCTCRPISAATINTPDPIIDPITIVVASNNPKLRCSSNPSLRAAILRSSPVSTSGPPRRPGSTR